ncbi:MAG TPA: CBS domain-containing protein [Thermoleophilaceae bacterium]
MPITLPRNSARTTDPLLGGDPYDIQVRELMTPGVVTIAEDASLARVYGAIAAHGVHAVLVLGIQTGRPLGWVTARGLLAWMDSDHALVSARDAITEPIRTIEPAATARDAIRELSQPGTTHLLVARSEHALPEGVVSSLNLMSLVRSS